MIRVRNAHRAEFSDLPAGWRQWRMKAAVARYQTEKNENPDPTVLSLTKSGLRVKTDLSFGKSTENYVGHQVVRRGQFVFTPRDFDATPILCGVSEHDGCISNLYIVFDISANVVPKYLEYYFYGLKYGFDYFEKLSFGMRYSFNRSQFENIPLILPPIEIQKTIADFLDRETARIDQLIEKKQRLVELLREKRSATITATVTKGLDPNVAMRDSGIELVGKIPEHWEVRRLKHLICSIDQGWSPQSENRQVSDGEWGVLKVGCVNKGLFRPEEHKALPSGVEPRPELEVRNGDLLMSRGNTLDLVGSAAIAFEIKPKLMLSDLLYRLVLRNELVHLRFAAYLLNCRALRRQIELSASGSSDTMPKISQEKIKGLICSLPPLGEQDAVVAYLDLQTSLIDKTIQATELSIKRLCELRSALITAAVIGQIEVETWGRRGNTERLLEVEEEMRP